MTDPYVSQPAPTPTDPSVTTATERATEVSRPESGSSADVVKSQSRMVADDAAEGGKRVARVAADEAATVADEAKNQARSLWEQASSQLSNQAADQKSTLASWLRALAEELRSMADAPRRDLVAYGSPSAGTPGFATGHTPRFPVSMPPPPDPSMRAPILTDAAKKSTAESTIRPRERGRQGRRGRRR